MPATLGDGPASIRVAAGGDLQAALDRANAGDVIELASGATFVGNFVLPAKSGIATQSSGQHRHAGLPDADGRVAPSHSGKLARIQSPNAAPALRTATGSHHWRLMLLELGPNGTAAGDILVLGDGSAAQSSPDRGFRTISSSIAATSMAIRPAARSGASP